VLLSSCGDLTYSPAGASPAVRSECYQLKCTMLETAYADHTKNAKPITTFWEVCPKEETASNLQTKKIFDVNIHSTYIEFKVAPTIPNSTGLNPTSHGFYQCNRIDAP